MLFSGPGVTPSLKGQASNVYTLAAGQTKLLRRPDWYMLQLGLYTVLQEYDPITQVWRTVGGGDPTGAIKYVFSDGQNYRLANLTGCAVGALLTNAGTGYTSVPTVTTTGGSLWRAIVGGAVSTSVTISNGGTNYTYAPSISVAAPPPGGIQATATCTISAGVVNAITVTNQGAGYSAPPTFSFVNDPREDTNGFTPGSGAAAIASLTGSGTVTGLLCIDPGNALTAVPTFTFSGGGGASAAATAIMCWTITSYTAGTAGAGLAGTVARVTAEDAFPTTSPAYTNPQTQSLLVKTRSADIKAPISGAGITATGQVVYDGGIYTSVPTPLVIPTASIVTTAPVLTFAMGGVSDTSLVLTT